MSKRKATSEKRNKSIKIAPSEISLAPIPLSRFREPIYFIALLAITGLFLSLALRLMVDIDIAFHLHGGEWIMKNRTFPDKDAYTYTVPNNDYIDLHWLYQLLMFGVYSLSGFEGLTMFNGLLILTALGLLLVRLLFVGTPIPLALLLLAVVGLIMELRYAVRPEVLTWSFLLLTILTIECYLRGNKKILPWLLAIHLVWVNMQGLFILGWGVMGAYCLSDWIHNKKIDLTLWKWCAIAGAICFVNPYHVNGVLFPFYLFTRLNQNNVFKEHVSEFISTFNVQPTDSLPFISVIPIYLFYAFSIVSMVLMLLTIRRRKVHEFLLVGAFFFLSASQIRNIPLFPLVTLPIFATALREVWAQFNLPPRLNLSLQKAMRLERGVMVALAVVALLFTVRVVNNAYYQSDRRFIKFGLGLEVHAHPVKASAFLNENGLDGRVMNDLNTGAYFGWKLKQKIFIDGRLEVMREEFFSDYKKAFVMGGLKTLIDEYQPQLIAFDFVASLIWNQQLRQMNDWRLIHLDETAAVYAHKTYAQHLPTISLTEALNRLKFPESFSEKERNELLSLPEPSRAEKWLSGFWRHQPYPYQLMELGVFCYQNGDAPAAERCYLQYIKETRGELAESYFNLASLYYRTKELALARYCYEKYLRMGGTHPLAQKRLLELKAK